MFSGIFSERRCIFLALRFFILTDLEISLVGSPQLVLELELVGRIITQGQGDRNQEWKKLLRDNKLSQKQGGLTVNYGERQPVREYFVHWCICPMDSGSQNILYLVLIFEKFSPCHFIILTLAYILSRPLQPEEHVQVCVLEVKLVKESWTVRILDS